MNPSELTELEITVSRNPALRGVGIVVADGKRLRILRRPSAGVRRHVVAAMEAVDPLGPVDARRGITARLAMIGIQASTVTAPNAPALYLVEEKAPEVVKIADLRATLASKTVPGVPKTMNETRSPGVLKRGGL